MEAPSGFEPEMEVLQTSALPLGDGAARLCRGVAPPARLARGGKVERETGFEPATSTLARSHSTTELFPPASNRHRTTRDRTHQPCRPGSTRKRVFIDVFPVALRRPPRAS